jgi:hypothetical protein
MLTFMMAISKFEAVASITYPASFMLVSVMKPLFLWLYVRSPTRMYVYP